MVTDVNLMSWKAVSTIGVDFNSDKDEKFKLSTDKTTVYRIISGDAVFHSRPVGCFWSEYKSG